MLECVSSLVRSLSRSPELSLSVYRTFHEPRLAWSHEGDTNPFLLLYVWHINARNKHSLKFMSRPVLPRGAFRSWPASAKLMRNHYFGAIGSPECLPHINIFPFSQRTKQGRFKGVDRLWNLKVCVRHVELYGVSEVHEYEKCMRSGFKNFLFFFKSIPCQRFNK